MVGPASAAARRSALRVSAMLVGVCAQGPVLVPDSGVVALARSAADQPRVRVPVERPRTTGVDDLPVPRVRHPPGPHRIDVVSSGSPS